MAQEKIEPNHDESKDTPFSTATDVTCTVTSGSGDVTINGQNEIRKFGGAPGEIKQQSFGGVTLITIKGTGLGQNKFRIDF